MAWQDAYRTPGNPFGLRDPRFYDELGHRGADYIVAAGTIVPAYEPGTVRYVETGTAGLGGIVGVDLDAGGHAAWAHLDPVLVRVGDRVKPGTPVGRAAGWDGDHGTLWDGPHIHTTLSPVSAYYAAEGIRPLLDPAPRIASALTSTAGSREGWDQMASKQEIEQVVAGVLKQVLDVKTKLTRLDVQEIHFKIKGDDRWCVAFLAAGTWAVCPSDDIRKRHVDVLTAAGRGTNGMAVKTWEELTGTLYVEEPLAFGRQVEWAELEAAA